MEQQLIAAVIGCGRMGAFTSDSVRTFAPACWLPLSHAEAIKSHPRLALKALSDIDPGMLTQAVEKYQVEQHFSKPLDLLNEIRPALVGIATRTIGRADLMLSAIAAGTRAIHAEKPLCNSVSELNALRTVLEREDVFVTYGAIRRFLGIYQRARALADSGQYGALREIRVNLGSAPLFWTHPHSIDLLLFGAGNRRAVGVQAYLADVVSETSRIRIESDPRVITASIYFEDGVVGHITQALGSDFVLSCENAEIVVRADGSDMGIYSVGEGIYPTMKPQLDVATQEIGGTLAPISQLVACIDGDLDSIAKNAIVKRDILAGQQIAFAMLQSHLEGSRIISLFDVDPEIVILARTGGRHA